MAASDRSLITLRLSVPYASRWGQTVKVVGAGSALGDGDVAQAPALSCKRHGDQLVWAGEVPVVRAPAFTYKYVVVGEDGAVEDEELRERSLELPPGLQAGAVVDVHDEWQVRACLPSACRLWALRLSRVWCTPVRAVQTSGGAIEAC